jgi:hypothetical protein
MRYRTEPTTNYLHLLSFAAYELLETLLAVLALAVVILLADFAAGNDDGGVMPDDLSLVISK